MLVSYLSSKITIFPFQNLEELISKTNYRIAIPSGSYVQSLFENSKQDSWQEAWSKRVDTFQTHEDEMKFGVKTILRDESADCKMHNFGDITTLVFKPNSGWLSKMPIQKLRSV